MATPLDRLRRRDTEDLQKKSKVAVNYGLVVQAGVSCHTCRFRIDNGEAESTCSLVQGTVDPEHVCDLWETVIETRYNEDQPRGPDGRFGSGDGTSAPLAPQPGGRPGADVVEESNKFNDLLERDIPDKAVEDDNVAVAAKQVAANAVAAELGTKGDAYIFDAPGSLNNAANDYVSVRGGGPDGAIATKPPGGWTDANPIWQAPLSVYMNRDNYVMPSGGFGGVIIQAIGDKGPSAILADGGRVANTPEAQQMVREATIAGLIHGWATTSNDTNARALAMQDAVQKEFNLKGTAEWKTDPSAPLSLEANVRDEIATNGPLLQAFVRAQYDTTQKALSAAGITEMTLYRGQGAVTDKEKAAAKLQNPGSLTVELRPVSSWSKSPSTAGGFYHNQADKGWPALMYAAVVPASRILSTPVSGFGCLGESECTVLGGTDTVQRT